MKESVSTGRISYFDFIKFIGLSAIILAHVDSPLPVMVIRSFDVPLMVIISAILSERSYGRISQRSSTPIDYCVSRIKRLLFPTWIFLTFYFVYRFIIDGHLLNAGMYLYSYTLTRYGIGYVWVILVYLYCGLLVPVFDKIGFSSKGILAVAICYVVYEVALFAGIGSESGLLLHTLYYIIPYGTIAFIGFNYNKLSEKAKYMIMCVSFVICVAMGIYYRVIFGEPVFFSQLKYPPRLYYLTYGVFCAFALLLFCEKHFLKIFDNSIIRFISAHSMWIYLWHILVLSLYDQFKLPSVWFVKFIVVYAVSIMIVVAVNKLLDVVERSHKFAFMKYLRG